STLFGNALLDRVPRARGRGGSSPWLHDEFDAAAEGREDYSWDDDYYHLGNDYDVSVDDDSEDDRGKGSDDAESSASVSHLERTLEQARPAIAAMAESPVTRDGPL
ncbi:MAG: hypothetical protein DMF66_04685, partial [Acidobacteria bacterium]